MPQGLGIPGFHVPMEVISGVLLGSRGESVAEGPSDRAIMMSTRLQQWREEKATGKRSLPRIEAQSVTTSSKEPRYSALKPHVGPSPPGNTTVLESVEREKRISLVLKN